MKSLWGHGERYLRIRRSAIDISPGVARMLVIGMIFLVVSIFIVSDVGLWNLWQAQKTLDIIESDISELESDISYLRRDISELENDPLAIERVAREIFGYMRPGERVYRIITVQPTR
jgi:cell division protein FtsB